jgi:hypothetical protein
LVVVVVVTLFFTAVSYVTYPRAHFRCWACCIETLCVCVYNFVLEMEMMMGYHKVINRFCTILCSAWKFSSYYRIELHDH